MTQRPFIAGWLAPSLALALSGAAPGPLGAQDLDIYAVPDQQTVGGFGRMEGVPASGLLGRPLHLMPEGVDVQLAISGRAAPDETWPEAGRILDAVVSPDGRVLYLVADIGPLLAEDEYLVSLSMDTLVFVEDPDAPGGYAIVYGEDPALLADYNEWFWDENLPLAGPQLELE